MSNALRRFARALRAGATARRCFARTTPATRAIGKVDRSAAPAQARRVASRTVHAIALFAAASCASHASEGLPYRLHRGLEAGDVHMGVRLLGALQLPVTRIDGIELVELSALGYDADADVLYLLSDQGGVFTSRLRMRDDALVGIDFLAAHALRDAHGKPLTGRAADSEGLSLIDAGNGRIDDTRLLVSFERNARVAEYLPDGRLLRDHGLPVGLDPRRFASINRGPEAIAIDARGDYLLAPERPLHGDRANHIAIFAGDGRRWFYPLATANSALVAMEMLDSGEVLVLERDFERLVYRLVTRLRIASGFEHDGDTLTVRDIASFDNHEGWRVDNFEGLTRLREDRYLMVSDNNESILQRSLLVMFELVPGRDADSPKYDPVQEAGR